ncbi:MAG: hypothetical protein J0L93_04355 [Deltaproteobacteria bacterium]|nr:hypothetical protein [Deltaproteobacteria bacterium]
MNLRFSFLWVVILSGFLASCRPEAEPTPLATTPTTSGGVIDASGGNITIASLEEVEVSLKILPSRVKRVLFRLPTIRRAVENFNGINRHITTSPSDYWIFTEEELARVPFIFDAMLGTGENPGPSAFSLFESGKITFRSQDSFCNHRDGHGDASATPSGEICFSKDSLRRLDPWSLPRATVALALHEIAHVMGLEEADARLMQKYFLFINNFEPILLSEDLKRAIMADLQSIVKIISYHKNLFENPDLKEIVMRLNSPGKGDDIDMESLRGGKDKLDAQELRFIKELNDQCDELFKKLEVASLPQSPKFCRIASLLDTIARDQPVLTVDSKSFSYRKHKDPVVKVRNAIAEIYEMSPHSIDTDIISYLAGHDLSAEEIDRVFKSADFFSYAKDEFDDASIWGEYATFETSDRKQIPGEDRQGRNWRP